MAVKILLLFSLLLGTLCADIVVVVAQDSPLKSLTRTEVRQLFLSNRSGDAVAVESSPNRLHERFYDTIAGKTTAQLRAYRARQIFSGRGKPPRQVSSEALEAYLQAHPDAVSYIDDAQLSSSLRIVYRLQ